VGCIECRSAWLVVDAQVKMCSREIHSPSRASKVYRHRAFQVTHLHTTVINRGCATQLTTVAVELASTLTAATILAQSPNRLRNNLKCVEWDVTPYYTHTLFMV